MKGLNGKSVARNWADLLELNEKLAKRGKALTDDQLKEKMYAQFPSSRGRTTVERVMMVRSDYNAGRGMFSGMAGVPAVASNKYEDGRTPIPKRPYRRGKKNARA